MSSEAAVSLMLRTSSRRMEMLTGWTLPSHSHASCPTASKKGISFREMLLTSMAKEEVVGTIGGQQSSQFQV